MGPGDAGPNVSDAHALSNGEPRKAPEAAEAIPPPAPRERRRDGPRRPSRSIGRAVRERLTEEVGEFLRLDAALDGLEPGAVHQARRATRRLRATLRLFRPYLDRLWAGSLMDEVRWIARQLGAVRDLDVVGALLFDGEAAHATLPLREAYEANRRLARAALAEALASRRRAILRDKLREACRHPWLRGELTKPARKRLRRRLRSLWRKLEAARAALRASPSDEAYHAIRKRGKDLRLALQIAAPDLGRRRAVRRLDRALGRLISQLGERQDAVVAGRLASELDAGLDDAPTERQAAVERIAALSASLVARIDAEFRDAWRAVRRAARPLLDD